MQKKSLFTQLSSVLGVSVVLVSFSGSALGAGFEKNVLWSGKWVGVGGAATSAAKGAESLYFNPAGLATGREGGWEVSGNFSPTWGKFEGPLAASSNIVDSGYKFSPVFGALVNYNLTPQLGIGVGAYVAAGTKAIFEDKGGFAALSSFFSNVSVSPRSELYGIEYALGAGYEVIPGLRLGASWRILSVKARVTTVYQAGAGATSTVNEADLNDLSRTRFNGFRVGAQYTASDDSWGLGANFRNAVDFGLNGTGSLRTYAVNATTATTSSLGDVSVASGLPAQINVGGNVRLIEAVRFYMDYVWTNYAHDRNLDINAGATPDILLDWKNQTNLRFGLACTALEDWTFRAGYVWTSQVTPDGAARLTFASPGHGTTFTLGAGVQLMEDTLDLDFAGERSFAKGTAISPATPGDISSASWAGHFGATYRF